MSKFPSSVRSPLAALTLSLSLALAGCVVGPAPDGDYAYGGAYVTLAPPAPQYEYYGVAPYPGWFWTGGFWRWDGHRYDWERGHWQAPRRGYRWVPHRWERGDRGWRERGGHWERDRRR